MIFYDPISQHSPTRHSKNIFLTKTIACPGGFSTQCLSPLFCPSYNSAGPQLLTFGFCSAGAGHRSTCYLMRKPCELGPRLKQEQGQGCGWGRSITVCQVGKERDHNQEKCFQPPPRAIFGKYIFVLFSSKDDFGGLLKQAAVNQLFEGPCVFMAHFSFKH